MEAIGPWPAASPTISTSSRLSSALRSCQTGAQGNGEGQPRRGAESFLSGARPARQILTFSRQTETEFRPIQIQLIVKEALKLLRATLPSTIQVRQDLASKGLVLGDPTQIHQVLMNLCTNAYQAMHARSGVLEVSLSETRIGASPPPDLKVLPQGPCLRLRVRDSGPGIDPAIIHRIFDPYFSTKEKGKGTGLGLAVVHGIVKSHRGAIQVSSRLGEGRRSRFTSRWSRPPLQRLKRPLKRRWRPRAHPVVDDEPSIEFKQCWAAWDMK
jgi:signal transduction histidine kinase